MQIFEAMEKFKRCIPLVVALNAEFVLTFLFIYDIIYVNGGGRFDMLLYMYYATL